MLKRLAAAAALVVMYAGCAGMVAGIATEKSRAQYVRENPGLTEAGKKAIMEGRLLIGMTEADVVAAIGRPYDINRSTYQHTETAQFVYTSIYGGTASGYKYVYFENGKVTSWDQ